MVENQTESDPSNARHPGQVVLDAEVLADLMEAGNRLAEAADQHWDEDQMGIALAGWEDALFQAGKAAEPVAHAHEWGPWQDDPAGVVRGCACGAIDCRPEG